MARVRRIIGIVVLLLGVLLIALGFTVFNTISNSVPDYRATGGSMVELTPQVYGSASTSITWSGANSGTTVTLYACPDSSCSGAPFSNLSVLTQLGTGTGGSGSFSASLQGGHTYLLAETGTPGGVACTATVTGFGLSFILGLVIAIIGLILVVLPSKAKAPTPESEEEAGSAGASPAAAVAPESPGAERVYSNIAPTVNPEPSSQRANLKCAHCGTMNEPWITNCRSCKRPLASTST